MPTTAYRDGARLYDLRRLQSRMRIVSLVPAATDIVMALDLGADLVGISHECAPGDSTPRPVLTRSLLQTSHLSSAAIDRAVSDSAAAGSPVYDVDTKQLADLRPDLILTQGLCDVCALPASVVLTAVHSASSNATTISLDARSIDGVLASIREVGDRAHRGTEADALVTGLRRRLDRVAAAVAGRRTISTVCLEWLDPPYASGHWIPEMVQRAGGIDLLGRPGIPSIPVAWEAVRAAGPHVVVAMPCGYDLHRAALDVAAVGNTRAWTHAVGTARVLVASGGGYFTRPGPRLVTGIEALAAALHPDVVTWDPPDDVIRAWP